MNHTLAYLEEKEESLRNERAVLQSLDTVNQNLQSIMRQINEVIKLLKKSDKKCQ